MLPLHKYIHHIPLFLIVVNGIVEGKRIQQVPLEGASGTPKDMVDQNRVEDKAFWTNLGQREIFDSLHHFHTLNTKVAKNVVIFIGDGMSLTTVTAARIYKAQQVYGDFKKSESHTLAFERFPHVGLSKTYNIDRQTSDSASTASAIFSGVKTKHKTLGFDSSITKKAKSMAKATKVETVLSWAQQAGKRTGMVTTTRLTHATPAALYAHSFDRKYECDHAMESEGSKERPPEGSRDIAWQLVNQAPGNKLNVMLGGGMMPFYPVEKRRQMEAKNLFRDTYDVGYDCFRKDKLDLAQKWQDDHDKARIVFNNAELQSVNADDTDHLMGFFGESHMSFDHNRYPERDPSLANMTRKAVEILSKNDEGFFLLVEGGRIDHAHHKNKANKALSETVAMDLAVETLLESLTQDQLDETLIIVTADHSHTMTLAASNKRGKDIRGLSGKKVNDGLEYTILSYANGQGFYKHLTSNGQNVTRVDPKSFGQNVTDFEFVQASSAPKFKETHGGDDVAIYARGPWSHLFHKTHEQSHIAHVMAYSACLAHFAGEDRCAQVAAAPGFTPTIGHFLLATFLSLAFGQMNYL